MVIRIEAFNLRTPERRTFTVPAHLIQRFHVEEVSERVGEAGHRVTLLRSPHPASAFAQSKEQNVFPLSVGNLQNKQRYRSPQPT